MADLKRHWAIPVSEGKHHNAWKAHSGGWHLQACGRQKASAQAVTAAQFAAKVKANSDWYCSDCAKAARLALAKERAPKPEPSKRTGPLRCTVPGCGSYAVNPEHHGRTYGVDLDLCDVCYWRKRAHEPRPIREAPKDGTEIMGWCPGYGWRHLYLNLVEAWVCVGTPHVYQPTHFLPLPPSPEVK
jgi:hypothetical protein